MNSIICLIVFLLSVSSYSQIDATYEDVQQSFGNEIISTLETNENSSEVKRLNSTETIKFMYNSKRIVENIEVESSETIDTDRFHKLAKRLVPNFKLTSSASNNREQFFYDSNNKLLIVKSYATLKKSQLTKICFISQPSLILTLIPDIENWK